MTQAYAPNSSSAGKNYFDSEKIREAATSGQRFSISPLLFRTTHETNLKFNHPFAQCPLPAHLEEKAPEVSPRNDFIKRQNVHSYFRPRIPDLVREMAKKEIRD